MIKHQDTTKSQESEFQVAFLSFFIKQNDPASRSENSDNGQPGDELSFHPSWLGFSVLFSLQFSSSSRSLCNNGWFEPQQQLSLWSQAIKKLKKEKTFQVPKTAASCSTWCWLLCITTSFISSTHRWRCLWQDKKVHKTNFSAASKTFSIKNTPAVALHN